VMFYAAGALLALAALASLALPRRGAVSLRAARGEWRSLLGSRPFVRLLVYAFLAYLSMQGPMVLFPILVRAQGGLYAIFASSIYTRNEDEQPVPAISPGTLFHIGRPVSLAGPHATMQRERH